MPGRGLKLPIFPRESYMLVGFKEDDDLSHVVEEIYLNRQAVCYLAEGTVGAATKGVISVRGS